MSSDEKSCTIRCQFCDTWNRVLGERASSRPKCGSCGRFLLLDRPWPLFEDSFARTISDSQLPVLVDFYADWCGPCKVMAPVVDALAAKYIGRALVTKLDTDRAQQLSSSLNIRGIPTTIVFVGGKEVARQSGAMPLAVLEALLQRAEAPPPLV